MIWLGSLFLVVLSRNRAGGGGGASVWAPTMDHHLCSCSGNPTARNNHSYTLEGEAAAPIALSLQNLNSSQSLHMYFFKVSSRPAISGIYDCRWWVIWLIYLPLTFDLLPHAPSSTSTSSSASSCGLSAQPGFLWLPPPLLAPFFFFFAKGGLEGLDNGVPIKVILDVISWHAMHLEVSGRYHVLLVHLCMVSWRGKNSESDS